MLDHCSSRFFKLHCVTACYRDEIQRNNVTLIRRISGKDARERERERASKVEYGGTYTSLARGTV